MSITHRKERAPYSRTRNLNGFTTVVGRAQQFSDGSMGHKIYADFQRIKLVPTKHETTDIVTPGYERKIAAGKIINNPYSTVKTAYADGSSGFVGSYTSGSNVYTWSEDRVGCLYFGIPSAEPHSINVRNLQTYTETACLASATTSSLQGLVALGEGKKTLAMLANPLRSLSQLTSYLGRLRAGNKNIAIASRGRTLIINGRSFRNPNFYYRGPGKLVKVPTGTVVVPAGTAISGSILANNLGLRPLMMDIEAVLKDIPQAHQQDRVSYRKKLGDESTKSVTKTYSSSGVVFQALETTETKVLVKSSVLVQDRFDIPLDFGVSLYDIPSAAWELIPYSFVLDYFINIGDVLGASRAELTQKILAYSTVTETSIKVTRQWLGCTLPLPYIASKQVQGTEVYTSDTKVRRTYFERGLAYRPISRVFRPTVVQNLLSLIVQQLAGLNAGKKLRTPFY